jgi:hypothetical protein
MLKKIDSVEDYNGMWNISFEQIVSDLILISITRDKSEALLSYCRLANIDDVPPLEIGFNCTSHRIDAITFFVGSEHLQTKKMSVNSVKTKEVIFDTDIFAGANDFIDLKVKYDVEVQEDKLICYFNENCNFNEGYKSGRIELYFDLNDELIGFAITNLLSYEKELINRLKCVLV